MKQERFLSEWEKKSGDYLYYQDKMNNATNDPDRNFYRAKMRQASRESKKLDAKYNERLIVDEPELHARKKKILTTIKNKIHHDNQIKKK